jgi:hypothetical protein
VNYALYAILIFMKEIFLIVREETDEETAEEADDEKVLHKTYLLILYYSSKIYSYRFY